jgi:hypothetical protein
MLLMKTTCLVLIESSLMLGTTQVRPVAEKSFGLSTAFNMLEALFLSQFGTAALNPGMNTPEYQESLRERRNIDALPTLGAEVTFCTSSIFDYKVCLCDHLLILFFLFSFFFLPPLEFSRPHNSGVRHAIVFQDRVFFIANVFTYLKTTCTRPSNAHECLPSSFSIDQTHMSRSSSSSSSSSLFPHFCVPPPLSL